MLAGPIAALVLVVCNIMSNPLMSAPSVSSDVSRVFALRAGVVCANELGPARYRTSFRRHARAAGYRVVSSSSPNAVAVRSASHLRAATARVRKLSSGVDGITPDRWATVVQLVDNSARRAVVICTQLVSRAWTHVERSTALRRELWRAEARRVREIVAHWHARGRLVLVLGDLNHPRAVSWSRRQRQLANVGLMQAAAIPPAHYVATRAGARTISASRLATDHPIVRRGVRITR